MQQTNHPVVSTQPVTPGTAISGIGSALLTALFFVPWMTACNVEVSGLDLATQQSPQGQSSAILLLGIPLIGLVGIILALSSLNKPPSLVSQRAKVTLCLAFYPLLCLALLYLSMRSSQPEAVLARAIIKLEFGFWGTALASLAMIGGAILDIATARGVSPLIQPSPRSAATKPPGPSSYTPTPITSPVTSARAWLEGQSGDWVGQRVEFRGDVLAIGRQPDCDLRLTAAAISRQHAMIRCGRGRYFIQDQGSTIGTYVNGQRVDACELKSGDVIRIGQSEFRFHLS